MAKNSTTSQSTSPATVGSIRTEDNTRSRILQLLLHERELSAPQIAEQLHLTGTAVRRHLTHLANQGFVAPNEKPKTRVTRGRPAAGWVITQAGRSQFGHNYDVLARTALAALHSVGGEKAVRNFARDRARGIVAGITPANGSGDRASPGSVTDTASKVAAAFREHGYDASVQFAGNGVQICQHHCPIASVAKDFPELCDAEAEVIAELVGLPVQPLATMSGGQSICTTNVPIAREE